MTILPPSNSKTTSNANSGISEKKTLYERMGGDDAATMITNSFFDELIEHTQLSRFFRHVSRAALAAHQVKLFRVVFGPAEEQPEADDLMDFMLQTHTRLFREMGLNETHFDMVGVCLLGALESSTDLTADVIQEIMTIIGSLRPIFAYGAAVAEREKQYSPAELAQLPRASAQTIGSDTPCALPVYSQMDIPAWLEEKLRSSVPRLARDPASGEFTKDWGKDDLVRSWTCALTDAFTNDSLIADTFLDQPYMDHHIYAMVFLQLAFGPPPASSNNDCQQDMVQLVAHPRGRHQARLSQEAFQHMVKQFVKIARARDVKRLVLEQAHGHLQQHVPYFAAVPAGETVGGVQAPHILCRRRQARPVADDAGSVSSHQTSSSWSVTSSADFEAVAPQKVLLLSSSSSSPTKAATAPRPRNMKSSRNKSSSGRASGSGSDSAGLFKWSKLLGLGGAVGSGAAKRKLLKQ